MFDPDASIRHVAATPEQVVSLVEGINQPQVSIPGKPPQSVQGYLCGLREADGSTAVLVALHLPLSGENVVYVADRRPSGPDEYAEVELEGLHFLESMGFMLDNLNFHNLAPAQQAETLRRVPLFHVPGASTPPVAPARPLEGIGRLLASV